MFYDVSGQATWVREMFFDRGYGAAGATLGMYFPTFSLSSFLSLMKEKRAKENQAPTGGREVGRVQVEAGVVFYDVGGRAARVREMFLDGDYGATGASLGRYFQTFFLSSFLSLMKEKRAKENQAPTGGGEVGWVRDEAGVVFSDGGEWVIEVREMFLDGDYGAVSAALGRSLPTFSLSSFLSLMKGKRAKENQAPTGGGEVGRVQVGAGVVSSEIGRVWDGAGVVFSDEGRQAKKSPPNVLTGATCGWWRTTEWTTWATLSRGLSDREWRGGCKAEWWPKCRSAWASPG